MLDKDIHMMKITIYISLLFAALSPHADDILRKSLEGDFATAILLSDTDAISLGFHDFNPNEFIDISDNLGDEEALELRKQINVYTLPYDFSLNSRLFINGQELDHYITILGSYLKVQRDIQFSGDNTQPKDTVKDEVVTLSGKYWTRYYLDQNLSLVSGLKAHLQYFKNSYTYRNPLSIAFRDQLDGIAFNTTAWSLTLQPNVEFIYRQPAYWGRWETFTDLNYFYGEGWGEANQGDVGKPEGWYWINGIKAFWDIVDLDNYDQSIYTSLRRIDIGGDLQEPLGSSHYYEWSLGWLSATPFGDDYVENIGIGININYGSSLKGGTIVLLINQK